MYNNYCEDNQDESEFVSRVDCKCSLAHRPWTGAGVLQALVSIHPMSKSLFFQQSPLLWSSFIAFSPPPPSNNHRKLHTKLAYDYDFDLLGYRMTTMIKCQGGDKPGIGYSTFHSCCNIILIRNNIFDAITSLFEKKVSAVVIYVADCDWLVVS